MYKLAGRSTDVARVQTLLAQRKFSKQSGYIYNKLLFEKEKARRRNRLFSAAAKRQTMASSTAESEEGPELLLTVRSMKTNEVISDMEIVQRVWNAWLSVLPPNLLLAYASDIATAVVRDPGTCEFYLLHVEPKIS